MKKIHRLLILIAILCLAGCGMGRKAPDAAPQPARSKVERGPVRVTVEVEPARARLSDLPVLTLTIDHEEGVTVEKPPFGTSLGRFLIRDYREPLPKIHDGREVLRQVLTLEPTEVGQLRIDPIYVAFTDNRPSGDHKAQAVETEALTIHVSSLVGDETPSLDDLRSATGPVEMSAPISGWVWGGLFTGIVAAAAAWWLWRRRRRENAIAAILLSPEELANLELDKLVESGLAQRDIKLFYVELTSIVRRYIERTTGVRAPEQTTEEFLHEISRTRIFERDDCSRLRDFLESADLVKFAAYHPRTDDIAESIQRARLFVGMRQAKPAMEPEEVLT